MDKTKIIAAAEAKNSGEIYTTKLLTDNREFIADEPLIYGGADKGATPAQYLCMSLASCKAITLRMYVNRKKWKIDEIKVNVSMVKGAPDGYGPKHILLYHKTNWRLNARARKALVRNFKSLSYRQAAK